MNIDWSKAPVDATHHFASQNGYAELWAKPGFFMRADSKTREWLKDNSPMGLEVATARPKPWTGEGQPPAGTVCEVRGCMSHYLQWNTVTVFAVRGKTVMFDMEDGRWGQTDSHEFRPIRTPEQIAAEEREKYVQIAMDDTRTLGISDTSKRILIERLYDSGHRK